MAELDFIFTRYDQALLFDTFLKSGAIIVPYFAYNNPNYTVVNDAESFQELVESNKMYGPAFVSWRDYKNIPYTYDEVEKEGHQCFFLKQRHGGPYLNFLPCSTANENGGNYITSGFVGYYTWYWSEELKQEIPVPSELKKHYKYITAFIRNMSKRIQAGNRTYWVGLNALDELSNGSVSSVDGLEITMTP